MATVPILQPQVDLAPMPGVRQNLNVPGDMGFSKALGNLSETLSSVSDKIDTAAASAALAKARQAVDALQGEAYKAQGMNANGGLDAFQAGVKSSTEQITKDLTGRQKALFEEKFAPHLDAVTKDVGLHVRKQLDQATFDGLNAVRETARDSYTQNITSVAQRAQNWAAAMDAVDKMGALKGWLPEYTARFKQNMAQDMHAGAVTRFRLEGDHEAAASYLDDHKKEMDPKFHSDVTAQVKKDRQLVKVQAFVDGMNFDVALKGNYDAQRAKAEAKLTGEERDMAVKRIDDLQKRADEAQKKADKDGQDRYLSDLADGKVDFGAMTSAQFAQKYPGESALKLWSAEQTKARGFESGMQLRKDAAMAILDFDPYAPLDKQNPEKSRILEMISRVRQADPDAATGLYKELDAKVAQSRAKGPLVEKELNDPNSNLNIAVRKLVKSEGQPWFGSNPLKTDEQVNVFSEQVMGEMRKAADLHPEWNNAPAKLLEYFYEQFAPKITEKTIPRMWDRMRKDSSSAFAPQAPFTPGSILRPAPQPQTNAPAPIVIKFSSDDAATAQNVRTTLAAKPQK